MKFISKKAKTKKKKYKMLVYDENFKSKYENRNTKKLY